MRRTTRRALAAAVLLAGALAAATGATAAPARVGLVPVVGDEALAQAVEDLAGAAAATYPETYGGTHRDPVTGVVTVSFTRDAAAATARLLGGFPDPGLVRSRSVARSLGELDALLARVTRDVPRLRTRGDFAYAYVDVPGNAVAVAFASGARHEALVAAYGPAVRVEQGDPIDALQEVPDACPSRETCLPYLRGGTEMASGTDKRTDSGAVCTSGFPARRGGRPAVITAGHCFVFGSTVMLGGAPLGTVTAAQFSGAVDGEVVEALEPWQLTNWLYWTPTDTRHQVRSVARNEVVGNRVCRVGRTTARTAPVCGPILATNVTISYPASGRTLTHMRMAKACGIPGDSGGPILYGSRAYGVLSGGNHRTNADGTYSCNPRPHLAWSSLATLERTFGVTVQLG